MAEMTVEGIYENGRIHLAGKPKGVKRARVTVTFFPEADAGLPVERGIAEQGATPTQQAVEPGYPLALREEYKTLIHKKLRRTLTSPESVRLDAIREQIN